jgi:hypothetical protein
VGGCRIFHILDFSDFFVVMLVVAFNFSFYLFISSKLSFLDCVLLGFELRILHLLGRHSTTLN